MKTPEAQDLDIAPLLAEELRRGRSVRFRAEGKSMEPFLYAGDSVVVDPIKNPPCPPALRPGTVLLYEPKPGILRLHRLSRIQKLADGTYRYRVRGDAPRQPPEEIAAACVLGTLVSFEHSGRCYDANKRMFRWTGLW